MPPKSAYKIIMYSDESGAIDVGRASAELGLSASSLRKYLRILQGEGLVERAEGKYLLTERGKKLKKALERAAAARDVPAYILTEPESGRQLPLAFKSHEQLYAILKYGLADPAIVEKHIRMGFLAEWASSALGDEYLADLLRSGAIKTAADLLRYLERLMEIAGKAGP